MQVEGINPGRKVGWQKAGEAAETEEIQPQQQGGGEVSEVEGEQSEQTDSHGVLRLLQEGHFKGVADVRLRINFHDELAGIQAAAVDAAAGEKINAIMGSIGGVVNSFLQENTLTEEQTATVLATKENFVQAASATGENPAVDLTAAFEAFITALQNLFAEDSAVNRQGLIENLQTTFVAGMAELTDAVSGVSALPPLSEPKGNGVAYDKFLAIYNQINTSQSPGNGLDQTEPT